MGSKLLLINALLLLVSGCVIDTPRVDFALQPFMSDESFEEYLHKSTVWFEASTSQLGYGYGCDAEDDECVEEVVVTGSYVGTPAAADSDPITNNQESGVDEGDIVKRIGDHIVLLRRGRLFSFSLPSGNSQLQAIDYIDVAPAGEDIDAWYDEILVHGQKIVLTGYSYDMSAVLIRLFDMAISGELSRVDSYFFTSSDYFDAENYATRIIDGDLIFYMPSYLLDQQGEIIGGQLEDGQPVNVGNAFTSQTIYQPLVHSDDPVLHTVATCPLNVEKLVCSANSFFGPEALHLYVSNDAVYLWLNSDGWAFNYFLMNDRYVRRVARNRRESYSDIDDLAVVYRIPIDGSEPGAIQVFGWPMNQFSFRETSNSLQIFVRDTESRRGSQPGILTIPLEQFSPLVTELDFSNYQALPRLHGYAESNRFIGNYLLYGDIEYLGDDVRVTLMVKNLESNSATTGFPINHQIERIEPFGERAIVIGTDETTALGITPLNLATQPELSQTTWLNRAIQADERSHSFNFLLDGSMDVFGLPVIFVPEGERYNTYFRYGDYELHMAYYGVIENLGLRLLGQLHGKISDGDECLVSCDDWYGDSRPFFVGNRVYALLGYELIEGVITDAALRETARADSLMLLPEATGK